jgi:hypothetical protein
VAVLVTGGCRAFLFPPSQIWVCLSPNMGGFPDSAARCAGDNSTTMSCTGNTLTRISGRSADEVSPAIAISKPTKTIECLLGDHSLHPFQSRAHRSSTGVEPSTGSRLQMNNFAPREIGAPVFASDFLGDARELHRISPCLCALITMIQAMSAEKWKPGPRLGARLEHRSLQPIAIRHFSATGDRPELTS